jgi:dynein heavy chain
MVRKRRADALLRGLSSEKQKWIVCSRMLDSKYSTVSGDVVLAAAIVTFGGAFTFTYRKQLVERWETAALQANGLSCSENFLI